MTTADALRHLREAKGWTPRELALVVTAQRCQLVTATEILRYEAGWQLPGSKLANILLTVLMHDPDEDPVACTRDVALMTLVMAAVEAGLCERETQERVGVLQ